MLAYYLGHLNCPKQGCRPSGRIAYFHEKPCTQSDIKFRATVTALNKLAARCISDGLVDCIMEKDQYIRCDPP